VQGSVVSTTAMVSVGVGVLMGASRALTIERSAGSSDWIALGFVYVVLRIYQLTWVAGAPTMVAPAILWAGTLVVVALTTLVGLRRRRAGVEKKSSGTILYVIAALDILAVLAPLAGLVPKEISPAYYIIQSIMAILAVWQAHRIYASSHMPAEDAQDADADVKGSAVATGSSAFLRQRNRSMCL